MSSGRYGGMMARLRQAVLRGPGVTDPSVRAAVEARAAGAAGVDGVPEPARAFVDKVIRHAYRVTDADIEALRAAGLSEDAIFELTISAALGSGRGRLERGLSALGGDV